MNFIRNFCIIAHIDHGKSTLSDRLIQATHTVSEREMKAQLLDSMDLERERGITIKMQAVSMTYKSPFDQETYTLNLIDTPGHVDFSYEVARSLAACEGALLLVDATQGIEAQTLANFYLALESDLEIIPVINKIDLPSSNVDRVLEDIDRVIGIPPDQVLQCSAKTGIGIEALLEAIVQRVPTPTSDYGTDGAMRALIYDAVYDEYRGVICYIRVRDGSVKKGDKIQMMSSRRVYDVLDLGVFKPSMTKKMELTTGEVGYFIANIKSVQEASIGDTITTEKKPAPEPLANYKEAKPMVFCGFYPIDTGEYRELGDALEKLKLSDSSLQFEVESSQALGFGYRCGFLGLLHMEIIQERLQREFDIEIIVTAPSVTYRVTLTDGNIIYLDNPNDFPDIPKIEKMEEPFVGLSIITPNDFLGSVMTLARDNRGLYKKTDIVDGSRQMLTFEIPLNEIITNFFDRLKSLTKGYASMDYWLDGFRQSDLVKVSILINGDPVDALSFIAHKNKSSFIARKMAEKLRTIIPRQLYDIAIQGAIGGKIICRETIKALRKNVTAKCYGGDVSRKRKLLEKQKKGKKKMKTLGSVEVPKEAFLSVLGAQEGD